MAKMVDPENSGAWHELHAKPQAAGTIARGGKIGKKLFFGTIGNRNL